MVEVPSSVRDVETDESEAAADAKEVLRAAEVAKEVEPEKKGHISDLLLFLSSLLYFLCALLPLSLFFLVSSLSLCLFASLFSVSPLDSVFGGTLSLCLPLCFSLCLLPVTDATALVDSASDVDSAAEDTAAEVLLVSATVVPVNGRERRRVKKHQREFLCVPDVESAKVAPTKANLGPLCLWLCLCL